MSALTADQRHSLLFAFCEYVHWKVLESENQNTRQATLSLRLEMFFCALKGEDVFASGKAAVRTARTMGLIVGRNTTAEAILAEFWDVCEKSEMPHHCDLGDDFWTRVADCDWARVEDLELIQQEKEAQ